MSFVYSATSGIVPDIPNGLPNISRSTDLWIGEDDDSGYIAFCDTYRWYIVRNNKSVTGIRNNCSAMMPSIVIDGTELRAVFLDCHGYIFYMNGAKVLSFVPSYGWVYMTNGAPGYIPEEYYDKDGNLAGDEWYQAYFTGGAFSDEATIRLEPRGKIQETGSEKLGTFKWERWECSSGPFGEYEPKGGASGTRTLGCPQWKDNKNTRYIRSLEKEAGDWNYGTIHEYKGKWIIGAEGDLYGWYEGEEPSLTSSVTFKFCVPEGSELTGEDLTVTFEKYVEGDHTTEVYLGEVAVWH